MTPILLRTLDFIKAYHDQHRIMPTLEDIRVGVGLSSRSSAHKHVSRLIYDGHLVRTHHGRRNIALANDAPLAQIPTADLRAELARREVAHG